jgi:hypothetical protein
MKTLLEYSTKKLEILQNANAKSEEPSETLFFGTSGLVSASQIVQFTASAVAVSNPTTSWLHEPLFQWPIRSQEDIVSRRQKAEERAKAVGRRNLADILAEGYKTMGDENRRFAEEILPIASEIWPTWEV